MIERDNQKDKTQKPEPRRADKASQHERPEVKKAVDDVKPEEVQDKEYAKRIEEKTEKH